MYCSTPPCQATRVVARARRMAPLGATRLPQARAGSAWKTTSARAATSGSRSLIGLRICESPLQPVRLRSLTRRSRRPGSSRFLSLHGRIEWRGLQLVWKEWEMPANPPENLKLTIELVPETCWYSNMRSALPRDEWDRLRRQVYADYGHRCGICGARGKLHCHSAGTMTTLPTCRRSRATSHS